MSPGKRFETSTDDSSRAKAARDRQSHQGNTFFARTVTNNYTRSALASAGDVRATRDLVDEFRPRTVRVTHARVAAIDSSLGSVERVREDASALASYLVRKGSKARGGRSVAVVQLQAGLGLHATPEEVEDAFDSAVAGHGDVVLAREGGVANRGEARLPAQTVGIGHARLSDAELGLLVHRRALPGRGEGEEEEGAERGDSEAHDEGSSAVRGAGGASGSAPRGRVGRCITPLGRIARVPRPGRRFARS